jgi:hypothetical protein
MRQETKEMPTLTPASATGSAFRSDGTKRVLETVTARRLFLVVSPTQSRNERAPQLKTCRFLPHGSRTRQNFDLLVLLGLRHDCMRQFACREDYATWGTPRR